MDKQKQMIEEIHKEYVDWALGLLKTRFDLKPEFYDEHHHDNFTYECGAESLWVKIESAMKELLWLRERQIPENAVVLMGTETEQRFEDLMVAFDEMGFMPNTTHPFPEEYVETWKQRLIFVFGQLRKETAEKFAERVKMAFYYEFDELIPSIMADKIDEICKEIIGEV